MTRADDDAATSEPTADAAPTGGVDPPDPAAPSATAAAGSRAPLREPAPALRAAVVALWLGYLPTWLLVLAVATPTVPVVLAGFALWLLLVARFRQSLRRFRCAGCGERYYPAELVALLAGTRCTACGR